MSQPARSIGFAADLLAGRHVAITGAAGGTGWATARLAGRLGAFVSVIDRTVELAADATERLRGGGVEGLPHAADLADPAAVARCVDEPADHGPISVAVNCAGVLTRVASEDPQALQVWDTTHQVNVRGAYLMVRHCLAMLRRTQGTIVNVSSVRAVTAAGGATPYTASKGGLNALTIALAHELGSDGVRVNAVAPGEVRTPMNLGGDPRADALIAHGAQAHGGAGRDRRGHRLPRLADVVLHDRGDPHGGRRLSRLLTRWRAERGREMRTRGSHRDGSTSPITTSSTGN